MSEFLDRMRELTGIEDETERDMRIIQLDADIDTALSAGGSPEMAGQIEQMQRELDETRSELTDTKRKYADLYFGKTQVQQEKPVQEVHSHPKTMAELFG